MPILSLDSTFSTEGQPSDAAPQLLPLKFHLSEAHTQTVFVNYSLANGTAVAGLDYAARSGRVAFAPGLTEVTVPVLILRDRVEERSETFRVVLSNPVQCSLAAPEVTQKIIDDDGPPAVMIRESQGGTFGSWYFSREEFRLYFMTSEVVPGSGAVARPGAVADPDVSVVWRQSGRSDAIPALGDVDGDGLAELVISSSTESPNASQTLSVVSGLDGTTLLATLQAGQPGSRLAVADVDGDGRGEIILLETFPDQTGLGGLPVSRVTAHRFPDGAVVRRDFLHIDATHTAVGDLNEDGREDILAWRRECDERQGAYRPFVGLARFEVLDGATFQPLISRWSLGDQLADGDNEITGVSKWSVDPWAVIRDANADGHPDVVSSVEWSAVFPVGSAYSLTRTYPGPALTPGAAGTLATGMIGVPQRGAYVDLAAGIFHVSATEQRPLRLPYWRAANTNSRERLAVLGVSRVSGPPPLAETLPSLPVATVAVEKFAEGQPGAPLSRWGAHEVTVSLSMPADAPVVLGYRSVARTAVAGVDFRHASGSLTIPPGTTAGQISVPVYQDRLQGVSRDFDVEITSISGATAASALARQTIVDDDGVLLLCSESIQRATEYPVAANPIFRLATGTSEMLTGASSQSALLSTGFMGGAVGLGDWDADGLPDLILHDGQQLRVFSGHDGNSLLASMAMPDTTTEKVEAVGGPDLDADGRAEIVVVRRRTTAAGVPLSSTVTVLLSPDFSLLWQKTASFPADQLIVANLHAGNLGDDGREEFILMDKLEAEESMSGAIGRFSTWTSAGEFETVTQIANGRVDQFSSNQDSPSFVDARAVVADLNGDGFTDLQFGSLGQTLPAFLNARETVVFPGPGYASNPESANTSGFPIWNSGPSLPQLRLLASGGALWRMPLAGQTATRVLESLPGGLVALGAPITALNAHSHPGTASSAWNQPLLWGNVVAGAVVEEGSVPDAVRVLISLSEPAATGTEFDYQIVARNGQVELGTDLTPVLSPVHPRPGHVTVPAGATAIEFAFKVRDDPWHEGTEDFEIILFNLRGAASITGPLVSRILDNDLVTAAPEPVAEGTALVRNPSFELNSIPAFPGYGAIEAWEAAGPGQSGVNDVTQPFANNGIIPDQRQVAFLQVISGTESLSQQINRLIPGQRYWLQFQYNARSSVSVAPVSLEACFDGQVLHTVANVQPVGAGQPYVSVTAPFTATATGGLLEFIVTGSGADATVLLDAVSIVPRGADDIVVSNPGFESTGRLPGSGLQLSYGRIAGWTTTGLAGTNLDGTGPFADNGMGAGVVAFLQYRDSSLSQTLVGLTPGASYTLSFLVNARNCCLTDATPYSVSIGGQAIFRGSQFPVGPGSPYVRKTIAFTAPASSAVLTFRNDTSEFPGPFADIADSQTLLLDEIRIAPIAPVSLEIVLGDTPGTADLTWPDTAPENLILQSSSVLTAGSWSTVHAEPSVSGGFRRVNRLVGASRLFFRLAVP